MPTDRQHTPHPDIAHLDLHGKVALVTGGAGGLGRAATAALIERGAQVALCDIDQERTEAAAGELGAVPFTLDVTDFEANHRVVKAVEEHFGGLDIAFLNAGIANHMKGAEALDVRKYRQIMSINLDGVVFGVDAAVPALMRRGGGTLVATASLAGLVSMPGDPYYTLTKAGVVGYVRALGPELARQGIRVHALCPGFADTAIIDNIRDHFEKANFPVIRPAVVADTLLRAIASTDSGDAWLIQAGIEPSPYRFRGVPAAKHDDGTAAGVPRDLDPDAEAPH
ncbi:MAG: SDR family NAD(P)-dependent oxidoreductase [Antricoccus sp.]